MANNDHKIFEQAAKFVVNQTRFSKLLHYIKNIGKRNAVFIWIPKNAGTSVFEALKRRGCIKTKKITRIKYRFSQTGLVTFGHMDYHQIVQAGLVKPEFDKSAFKFGLSRNPYDRIISLYEYLRKHTDKLQPEISFLDFCRYIEEHGIEEIGLYNGIGFSHCNPQVRWIEKINMDYMGRFENLGHDMNEVMKILDLPAIDIPHVNKSKRGNLEKYFCPESKEIVEKIYKEDFDYFKYPVLSKEDFFSSRNKTQNT